MCDVRDLTRRLPCDRLHPAAADLRRRHRLHLPVLGHGLRQARRLRAVQQRHLPPPVHQPGHCAEGRGLPALHHHLVLPAPELQEVHQGPREPHVGRRVLPLPDRRAQAGGQDKVHIQPGRPRAVREHGVGSIIGVLAGQRTSSFSVLPFDLRRTNRWRRHHLHHSLSLPQSNLVVYTRGTSSGVDQSAVETPS